MTLNQDIRFKESAGPDNPRGLFEYIKPSRQMVSNIPPTVEDGQNLWTYIDTSSGIQYTKINCEWIPTLDYTAIGPPPSVPDPLTLNNGLFVNTIQGAAGDGFVLEGGNIGDVQVLIGGGQAFQVGQPGLLDGVRIQNNGNVLAQSKVQGFELESIGGSHGIGIKQDPVSGGLIENVVSDLTIDSGVNSIKMASTLDMQGNSIINASITPVPGPSITVDDGAGRTAEFTANPYRIQPTGIAGSMNIDNPVGATFIGSTGNDIVLDARGDDVRLDSNSNLNLNGGDIKNAAVISGAVTSLSSLAGNLDLDATGFINIGSTTNWQLNDQVNLDQMQGPNPVLSADTGDLTLRSALSDVKVDAPAGLFDVSSVGANINGNAGPINLRSNIETAIQNFSSGFSTTINPNTGITSNAAGTFSLQHVTPAQNINLVTNAGNVNISDGTSSLILSPGAGVVATNAGDFTFGHFIPNNNVNITASGTGKVVLASDLDMAGNNILNYSPTITGDLDMTTNDVINVGKVTGASLRVESTVNTINKTSGVHSFTNVLNDDVVTIEGNTGNGLLTVIGLPSVNANKISVDGIGSIKKIGTSDLNIEHTNAGSNINLLTSGGVIRMQDGANTLTFDPAAERATIDKIVINELNFSAGKTIFTSLGTNETGVLDFRRPAKTVPLVVKAFGGNNSTDYFGLGENVAPGDYWAIPTGPNATKLLNYSMRLSSNAAFNLGGVGTCSLQVGYVLDGNVCTAANFGILSTTNVDNTADIYTVHSGDLALDFPVNSSMVARIFTAGTSATAANVELALTVTMQ